MKVKFKIKDPAYPQDSNKFSYSESIACKLKSLLDFLDAVHFGNARENRQSRQEEDDDTKGFKRIL